MMLLFSTRERDGRLLERCCCCCCFFVCWCFVFCFAYMTVSSRCRTLITAQNDRYQVDIKYFARVFAWICIFTSDLSSSPSISVNFNANVRTEIFLTILSLCFALLKNKFVALYRILSLFLHFYVKIEFAFTFECDLSGSWPLIFCSPKLRMSESLVQFRWNLT